MAEERVEPREWNIRQWLPWTLLFRGFQVAIDPRKLLLAAAGIVLMSLGWAGLSYLFYSPRSIPDIHSGAYKEDSWSSYRDDRHKWNLLYQAAGDGKYPYTDANDIALQGGEDLYKTMVAPQSTTLTQIDTSIKTAVDRGMLPTTVSVLMPDGQPRNFLVDRKVTGEMRTLPWYEDRGPNPYLLLTGQAGKPWLPGQFVNWLLTEQVPVLIEPLLKLLKPVTYLLKTNAGFWNRVYCFLVLVWTAFIWSIFGGAITRMAAVEVTRNERVGMAEALRFTWNRIISYFSAPLVPLAIVAVMLIALSVYGLIHWVPIISDVLDAVLWPLIIIGGLIMTVLLIGMIGWPMMYATLSTEGSDSFDAISRAYSYVYQNPWHYAWYSLVALAYGAVLVLFIGFAGSLTVYLGKLGVSAFMPVDSTREPGYLFMWSPTSFGWRDLLLQGSPIANYVDPATGVVNTAAAPQFKRWWGWGNYIGALMVAAWLYLVFLMVVGFGYSYFWTAGTIVYLLMRRAVDDTELDEVYLEEEDFDDTPSVVSTTAPSTGAALPQGVTMVDSPTLRSPAGESSLGGTPVSPGTTVVSSSHSSEGAMALPAGGAPTATAPMETSEKVIRTDGDVPPSAPGS